MCTTTHDKSNTGPSGAHAVKPPAAPSPADKQLPFAAVKYPTISTPDDKFQAALEAALTAQATAGRFGPNSRIAFSMIALADNGNHRYAGKFHDDMDFAASLVKVAAMYAAHELLAAARRLARRKGFVDEPAFRAALSSEFDPQIAAKALPIIKNLAVDPALMLHVPNYNLLFEIHVANAASEPSVEFSAGFRSDLVSMIKQGTNDGASRVIRKLSYDYINAALMAGGFFDPATSTAPQNGIWLAADYIGDKNKPQFNDNTHIPYVRIDCINDCIVKAGVTDCAVGQISTTRRMSNLFALIKLGKVPADDPIKVLDPDLGHDIPESCFNMKDLLSEPKPGPIFDTPWLDQSRLIGVTARFTVTHDKIGFADLKRGPNVYSEGLIVEWKNAPGDAALLARRHLTGKIAISWQNLVGPPPGKNFDGIARVVNDAFANYIATMP
jgi:hypothetical protein